VNSAAPLAFDISASIDAVDLNVLCRRLDTTLGATSNYIYTALRSKEVHDRSGSADCVADVARWFLRSGLLVHSNETDVVATGTAQRL
jgi:hypothetical protein